MTIHPLGNGCSMIPLAKPVSRIALEITGDPPSGSSKICEVQEKSVRLNPGLDEVGQQQADITTGVVKDPDVRCPLLCQVLRMGQSV